MRPKLRLLDDELVIRIVDEARSLLAGLGVEIRNPGVLELLSDFGARVEFSSSRAFLGEEVIDRALQTVPSSFALYDALGNQTHDFSGWNVYFTPGSAAIHFLDGKTGENRKGTSDDYVALTKLVSQLEHIAAQSTALIPADVPEQLSDSYRLFLSLLYGEKPVVTGAFTVDAFQLMKDLQVIVRGSEEALREKPLTIFSCCPTSPIKWCDVTSQNLVDCARSGIPAELISMPLAGFVAPVTLVGSLVEHTAETLSGIVISQAASPGAPLLYGGSPAPFDMRFETTPMGAVESMMICCSYNEIGKALGLPTQAYISISDSKQLDAQAGLETSMGATLAVLAGINQVSGPGMLEFESCQSLEKLVLDNEICGMALRLGRGVVPRDDFPATPHFEELQREKHLLISDHTLQYLKEEHFVPGAVIDRSSLERWARKGSLNLGQRASAEVERLTRRWQPSRISDDVKNELISRVSSEFSKLGLPELPGVAAP